MKVFLAKHIFFLKLVQNQMLDLGLFFKLIDVTEMQMTERRWKHCCQYVWKALMCTVCIGRLRFRWYWVQVVHRSKFLFTGLFAPVPY